jgi:hypothetical protein
MIRGQSQVKQQAALENANLREISTHDQFHGAFTSVFTNEVGEMFVVGSNVVGFFHGGAEKAKESGTEKD